MIKKISYSEFIREVESNILDFMPEDFANAEVSVRKVTKVNVDKYALNIRRTNEKISPTLYLDSFYKEGKYLNDTLKLIADTYVDYVNDSTINFRNINVVDNYEKEKAKWLKNYCDINDENKSFAKLAFDSNGYNVKSRDSLSLIHLDNKLYEKKRRKLMMQNAKNNN